MGEVSEITSEVVLVATLVVAVVAVAAVTGVELPRVKLIAVRILNRDLPSIVSNQGAALPSDPLAHPQGTSGLPASAPVTALTLGGTSVALTPACSTTPANHLLVAFLVN